MAQRGIETNGTYSGKGTIGGRAIKLEYASSCDNRYTNTVKVSSVSSEGISYSLITEWAAVTGILPSSGNEIACPEDSLCTN